MEKNEILMIYGKNYKEMTKEILTSAKLAEQIGRSGRKDRSEAESGSCKNSGQRCNHSYGDD